jgi:2-dehydro-3-deoxyglucarate aldolase/4-hydroxy-2-oxoheptanedioate aldolase
MSGNSSSASITERVRGGESAVGTFLNLGSPLAAEICARAGFDFAVVDLEHGAGTEAELIPTLQALGSCGAIVRVESAERPRVQRALDAGADGVMVPRVGSAAEAVAAVAATRYPPRGARGVAYMNRGADFGAGAPEADALVAIQVETRGAVDEAREIAGIDGVDVLFVGPADLTHSLGIPGQFGSATYREALERVVAACRASGKSPGILVYDPAVVPDLLEVGFRFVGIGADGALVADGARAALAAVRT